MLSKDLCMGLDAVRFAEAVGITPDPWQADVLRATDRLMILNCSRQAGKSTVASILSLHRATYIPDSLILLVSPSLRQSQELFRKVVDLFGNLQTKPGLIEDNKLSFVLENGSRIVSLPAAEQTVRGFSRVSLIVEDEAARVNDELYMAIRPMLAVSQGRLILMSTPFGRRGHFFNAWSGGEAWKRIEIPANKCPRITQEFLNEERQALGEWRFRQEYMCEFVENDEQCFTHEQIMGALSDEINSIPIL